jgi:hypothetical protein
MTRWALGWGEPPTNKILIYKPTPRSNFCFLAPAQFFTLQGFSDWVNIGVPPRGSTFGVAPWLGAEPGQNEEPMPNFGVMAHTHTYFHLYIIDSGGHCNIKQDLFSVFDILLMMGRGGGDSAPLLRHD